MSKATYDLIYQEKNRDPKTWKSKGFKGAVNVLNDYGHSNHGAGYTQQIVALNEVTLAESNGKESINVLDVGCGWNEFATNLRRQGVFATGIDCSCVGADHLIDLEHSKIPWRNRHFSIVTAFDFLEHIGPAHIETVLRELNRVSKQFIFTIGTFASVVEGPEGNLHEIIKPIQYWEHIIKNAGGIITRVPTSRDLVGYWDPEILIK